MKATRWIIMIVVLLTVAAGSPLLTYRYLKAGAPPVEQPDAKTPSPTDIRISTSQPVWRTFSSRLPWIGVVEARASVSLTALVDGRVEAIEAGDQVPVEAGAVVMRLGGPRVESERARLEAGVKSLKSQLALADQTVARFQQSLAEHLATKDDLAAAKQIQLQLQGQVRHAQLALDSFEEQLRIIAPMAGVFTRRRASTGQAVQAGQVLGEIVDADHLRIVASLFPPAGVALEGKKATVRLDEGQLFTGQYQVMQRTIRDFVLVGLAAVVLIYLIMAMQFRSWAQPLIILVTIPVALVGAIVLLAITRVGLDVSVGMGALTLVGIAVNNAIVLLDQANRQASAGRTMPEALRAAASVRLRPILMTAATTIFALIPVAANPTVGSRIFQPFAVTVIGGLLSATAATLVFVPVLALFGRRSET